MEERKEYFQEQQVYWDIFFDLHGVLADTKAVGKNYESYLATVLAPAGITRDETIKIHGEAFNRWIGEFRKLTDGLEGEYSNPERFMDRMRSIDREWEEFILGFVPEKKRKTVTPRLITSKLEYEALAKGFHPILYPEVKDVLKKLKKINGLSMHIASSASSHHVKGAVALHDLDVYFETVIGYDTVEAPKKAPSGRYFKNMLEITGANPARSFFVGDTIEESVLASKTGMKFIMVQRGQQPLGNGKDGIEFDIVRNLNELIPLIINYIG